MDPFIRERVGAVLGEGIKRWRAAAGGYTPAGRWVVEGERGARAFAKVAVDDATAAWLRRENAVYSRVEAPYLAALLGWDDDGARPILLLEDLSGAFWPPPWSAERVARVVETLGRVAATPPIPGVPSLEWKREALSGWTMVADDPAPFLALGLCTSVWIEAALPGLLAAQAAAVLDGDDLVHGDTRSDNLCFDGLRTVVIDWNVACRGNGAFDLAGWLPSLHMEGGPAPETLMSGYFASQAGLPPIPHAPRVRDIQLRQLRFALPWAVRALGLPSPADG